MNRKSQLTATACLAVMLSGLAWAPPAQSQNTQVLMCVDLQTTWNASIEIEERTSAGS